MHAASVPSVRTRWHALVERFLPWLDPEEEKARDQRSQEIRERSIAIQTEADRTRRAYQAMERRMRR